VLWGAAAVAIALRHHGPLLAQAAWMLAVLGAVAMVPHAVISRALGAPIALVYLPLAVVAAILIKKTFDRGEFRRLRREVRAKKQS